MLMGKDPPMLGCKPSLLRLQLKHQLARHIAGKGMSDPDDRSSNRLGKAKRLHDPKEGYLKVATQDIDLVEEAIDVDLLDGHKFDLIQLGWIDEHFHGHSLSASGLFVFFLGRRRVGRRLQGPNSRKGKLRQFGSRHKGYVDSYPQDSGRNNSEVTGVYATPQVVCNFGKPSPYRFPLSRTRGHPSSSPTAAQTGSACKCVEPSFFGGAR